MAGTDNILSLFLNANIDSLKAGLAEASTTFKTTVEGMKSVAATLPADIEASVTEAATAFVALNPQLQEQAANVLQLQSAYKGFKAELADTVAFIEAEGGALEVDASVIAHYTQLTVDEVVAKRAASDATKAYDTTLRELLNTQIEAAQAAKEEAAGISQLTAASATNVITDEARARVKAKLAELEALDGERATATAAAQTSAARTSATASETQAVAANTASEAYIRLARATIANAQAQAEVRAIASGAAEMVGLEGQFINELALAQERAALTALELSTATKALTVATEEASAAQSTFRGRIAISEFGVRGFISGMVTSLPVLIGIFAAGFAIRAVEAIRATELELSNLSILTGETVRNLYDMGKAAEAFGAKSDDLTGAFRRLDKTISDAASGNEAARLTLRELGVDMTEINSGIIPKTSTVLAQMADYLHMNAGNAEVMRAAMRALGSDSVALAAFLSQGSQKIREQAEQFTLTGNAMANNTEAARKLSEQQAILGATWDRIKLPLLELTNATINYGLKTLEAIGWSLTWPFEDLINGFNSVKNAIVGLTQSDAEYMAQAAKTIPALAAPLPPLFAQKKTEKEKAGPAEKSDLPEFREELAQRENAFEGSHAAMLAMELAFWENLISTGRVKARDLIAVHSEIARTEIQLRREVMNEAIAEQRDVVSVTRTGSAARVEEEQRLMELVRNIRTADSSEFKKAQAEYAIAVRDRVEETIRLNLRAIDENIALESRGSQQRVALYDSELASLQGSLATTQVEIKRQQDEVTASGSTQARELLRIAQGEADFEIAEIQRVTKERNIANREAITEAQKQRAEQERAQATRAIGTARENIGLEDVEAAKGIQQVEQNGLLTLREKEAAIRSIIEVQRAKIGNELADAEAVAESALANAQLNGTIEQQIAALRLLESVHKLQAAESKRLYGEELADDNRLAKQQEANALRVGSVISGSFSSAFDKMLTTHTNFAAVMTQFWNNMVLGFARMGIQILADWIKMIAARLVAWIAGEQLQTTAAASGASARNGIGLGETLKSIGRAAAKAAAWAWSGTMEAFGGLPFAIPLAALAAAGAFTAVLAFGALASAAGGAVLDKDTLVQAHAREMILPASISTGLQNAIGAGSLGNVSGSSFASSSSSSSKTFHIRPTINVNQSGGDSRMSTAEISTAVMLGIRKGMVNP